MHNTYTKRIAYIITLSNSIDITSAYYLVPDETEYAGLSCILTWCSDIK